MKTQNSNHNEKTSIQVSMKNQRSNEHWKTKSIIDEEPDSFHLNLKHELTTTLRETDPIDLPNLLLEMVLYQQM